MLARKTNAVILGTLVTFALGGALAAESAKAAGAKSAKEVPAAMLSTKDQAILVKGSEVRGTVVKADSDMLWVRQPGGEVVALKTDSKTEFPSAKLGSAKDLKEGQYVRSRFMLVDKTTNVATRITPASHPSTAKKQTAEAGAPSSNLSPGPDPGAIAEVPTGSGTHLSTKTEANKVSGREGQMGTPSEADQRLGIRRSEIKGRVIRTSDDTVWVENQSGPVVPLKIDSQTHFVGAKVKDAKDLQEGQPIRATFRTVDKTTNLAMRIYAAPVGKLALKAKTENRAK